jgi:hypothetical protein
MRPVGGGADILVPDAMGSQIISQSCFWGSEVVDLGLVIVYMVKRARLKVVVIVVVAMDVGRFWQQ